MFRGGQYSRDGEGGTGSTSIYSDVAPESRIELILLATVARKQPDVTPSISASAGGCPPVVQRCIPTNQTVNRPNLSILEGESERQESPTLRWWIPTNHETVDGPHGASRQPVCLFLPAVMASSDESLVGELTCSAFAVHTSPVLINAMATGRLQNVDHLAFM